MNVLVSWCFDPSQSQRIKSGLATNVNPWLFFTKVIQLQNSSKSTKSVSTQTKQNIHVHKHHTQIFDTVGLWRAGSFEHRVIPSKWMKRRQKYLLKHQAGDGTPLKDSKLEALIIYMHPCVCSALGSFFYWKKNRLTTKERNGDVMPSYTSSLSVSDFYTVL